MYKVAILILQLFKYIFTYIETFSLIIIIVMVIAKLN